MCVLLSVVMICALCGAAWAGIGPDDDIVRRGDSNSDGAVNVSDVIHLNSYLYQGGPAPACMNQADVNHDCQVDVSDPIYLLSFLFSGGPAPPSPGPYNTTCTSSSVPVVSCYSGC